VKVKSATVLLMREDGWLLAVSRGADTMDWGMPGGWLEPGESPAEGAARELWEETGIEVRPEHLRQVYEQQGCITFAPVPNAPVWGTTYAGNLVLEPQGEWEGYPAWVRPKTIACATCTFGASNGRMLRALGLL